MIDFIQVGDYKTGTSWLQKYFYPVHPEINYLGGPFKNDELEHLLHVLIDSRDLDFNGAQLRKDILRLLPDGRSQKVSGICREVFSGSNYISCENAKQNAERLFEVFGNVKIIFIIREQLDMIRSIYSQYLKIGGSLKIDNFIFDPIVSRGLIERLKWHKQIQMYYDLFGQENVHIGLYEEFKYDKQTFLTKLCQFLVIKNIEIKENEKIVNKSLTVFGETFARIGNRFFRSNFNNSNKNTISPKIIELLTSKKKLNYIINDTERRIIPNYGEYDLVQRKNYALNWRGVVLIRRISEKIRFGNSLTIPKEIDQFLKNYFKEFNCILKDQYNIPVEQYNYSI